MMFWPVVKEISLNDISVGFFTGGGFVQLSKAGQSNFAKGYHEEHFCENILNLVQEMSKDISFLQLWQPFCSVAVEPFLQY